MGIEHADPHTGDIVEALQSGLAGVAGGGGEDENVLLHPLLHLGGGEQLGQHGKSHILKSGGGATEQLQQGEIAHLHRGGQILRLKFAGVGPADQLFHPGDIRQQSGENGGGHLQTGALQTGLPVECRQAFGHIQAAVGGQTVQHGLGTVHPGHGASGGMIIHGRTS